ncbi:S-layer homology domain-containing protein [Janibacter cremeus]|uniref:S-layer homology domain-containing protein n=1 Tax=Janibacter cremeus TaxID=1285192 RepID=UPI0023F8A8E9|nr:S-layer homology domain-containing protein [Janibacter cremeus]WEV76641.1 S-layer homology domain-containing protein [Janibacter cremeus]
MSNTRTRPHVARVLALRLPLAAAVAAALVIGPTAIVDATGDEADPIDTAMEKVAVDGVSEEAARNTADVEFNLPDTAQDPQTRTPRSERGHGPVEPQDDEVVALTKKRSTRDFSALGLTWESEQEPVTVWVRTKTAGTKWSDWEYVPSSDGHGPDAGTSEATSETKAGTDPLIVPESDGVQVRVEAEDGTAPRGMKVNLIDPKTADQDARVGQDALPAGSAAAAGTKPDIITRAQWGADESIRRGEPSYGEINGGFVHHTDGTNYYTRSQSAGIVRAIYTFHVEGRGWNDIGYNFLVDKFGRIFEGRYGGVAEPVIGAHTLGYNSESFAMSVLGNYQSTSANAAVLDAYAELFAWKLGRHRVDPTSTVTMSGHKHDAISGHRDGYATACPGGALYAQLPKIRTKTAALVPEQDPPPFPDVTPYTTDFTTEITWLKDEGITTGYPDGTFGPKDRISREAMAAFFYRIAGEPEVTSDPDFTDVDASSKFADEIAWLQDEGITTGHPDGSFGPKERISREAMAAFMTRFVLDGQPPKSSTPYAFTDIEGTPFVDHIAWLADQGITTGHSDGTFRPRNRITREAVAAFLYRSQALTAS